MNEKRPDPATEFPAAQLLHHLRGHDQAERWRTLIGPLFRDIWPLDAKLRTEETAENLVLMAMECEGAFPDAVEAIVDLVVPTSSPRPSGFA
jgi:hypothetical protein